MMLPMYVLFTLEMEDYKYVEHRESGTIHTRIVFRVQTFLSKATAEDLR